MQVYKMKAGKYIIEYDPDADAAYIKVRNGKISESAEAGNDIIVDFDKGRKMVGIEILNFSKMQINLKNLMSKQFQNLAVIK